MPDTPCRQAVWPIYRHSVDRDRSLLELQTRGQPARQIVQSPDVPQVLSVAATLRRELGLQQAGPRWFEAAQRTTFSGSLQRALPSADGRNRSALRRARGARSRALA